MSNNTLVNNKETVDNKRKIVKGKKKKGKLKSLLGFLIFEIVFLSVTTPLLIFYGPFDNIKGTVTGSLWNSYTLKGVTRAFLSDAAIARILGDGYAISSVETENIKMLKFGINHTDEIELFDVSSSKFQGKMLVIKDPTRIKVGYSAQIPRAGETTSSIAKRNGAIAAINGGGFVDYKWAGTGGKPVGILMSNGKYISGELKDKDKKQEVIAFTEDGMLIVGKHSQNELKKYNVKEAINFGPPLVVNGKPTIKKGDGGGGISPRTVIGQKADGSVMFLVVDGRTIKSVGATYKEVQDIMLSYGAENAANLDGGSSTTMYYNGKVINTPSDALGERAVPSVYMVMP